jgi:hypothetical protein
MFSKTLLAHLNELISSLNLSYQYDYAHTKQESIHLQIAIQKLYELIKTQDLQKTNEYINNLKNFVNAFKALDTKDKFDGLLVHKEQKQIYNKSMAYSQLQMTKSIGEKILYQRYFNQFYEVKEEEALYIKAFLEATVLFIENYAELVIKD